MSFLEMLHMLVLGPIELLLENLFSLFLQFTQTPGLSIVLLSLAVNLLILPLYLRADKIQAEERETSARLKPGIDLIKENFTGDERFMILQTYYRQNHYKPWYVLRSSVSLLLQIPFFIAAYNYLSHLQAIQGVAFGPIRNLGAPDAMLMILGHSVNILPVIMTLINIASGMIYSRGMPLKNKIQLYGMALLFLVLLYRSPAGLVLYWTLNNVFSLAKNAFRKLPYQKAVLRGICAAVGIALLVYFRLIHPVLGSRGNLFIWLLFLVLQLPLLAVFFRNKHIRESAVTLGKEINFSKGNKHLFICCSVFLFLLTGFLIPSAIIQSSPGEFVDVHAYQNPLHYLLSSGLLVAGTFLLWCSIFFILSSEKTKRRFSYGFSAAALIAAMDYLFFGKGHGNMSSMLIYDAAFSVSTKLMLLNAGSIFLLAGVLWLLWKHRQQLLRILMVTACLVIAGMSVSNMLSIQAKAQTLQQTAEAAAGENGAVPLSKNGKNVVVIMLDRAISGFVPFILNEKPELMNQFSGFVYYPNTLSYGIHTNIASPSLFGGYEYNPDGIASRPEDSLQAKHNEALKVMPYIFSDYGYITTVCDVPYGNYQWVSDLSIYDEKPEIRKYHLQGSLVNEKSKQLSRKNTERLRNRNFFCYSLFRSVPLFFQKTLYNEGRYNKTETVPEQEEEILDQVPADFQNAYTTLEYLNHVTEIRDGKEDTFLLMVNDITHDVAELQEPGYVPANAVDNSAYEEKHGIRTAADGCEINMASADLLTKKHYQSNMAAFLLLGRWFDFLKENEVYDNTRIILVSDHAYHTGFFGFNLLEQNPDPDRYGYDHTEWPLTESYNPLLMIKDFGADGFSTDLRFMTNADTPTLAFAGLIENPVNPKTGNAVTNEAKYSGEQHLVESDWQLDFNCGNLFANPIHITLKGYDITNESAWSLEDN